MKIRQAILNLYKKAGDCDLDLIAASEEADRTDAAATDAASKAGLQPFVDGEIGDRFDAVMIAIAKLGSPEDRKMLERFAAQALATADRYWAYEGAVVELVRMVEDVTNRLPDGPRGKN